MDFFKSASVSVWLRTAMALVCFGSPAHAASDDSGLRSSWLSIGIEPRMAYTAELWGNVRSGFEEGLAYTGLGAVGLDVAFDAGEGATVEAGAHGLWVHGDDPSSKLVSDIGGVSNIAGAPTIRLFEAWLGHTALDEKVDIRGGALAIDDDFMVVESAQLFANSGFGTPQTLSLNVPAPMYPIGALGLRARLEPAEEFQLRIGAYDGDAGQPSDNPYGLSLGIDSDGGIIFLAEISRASKLWGRPAQLSLGGFVHTGRFEHFGRGRAAHGLGGAYFMVEHTLLSRGDTELAFFGHASTAFPSNRIVASSSGYVGLVLRGGAWNRPDDWLGLGYAVTHFGDRYASATKGALPGGGPESVVELAYRAEVLPKVWFHPDLQWVLNPHYSASNAVVMGLRVGIDI